MKNDAKNKKPFFARYLETQDLEEVRGGWSPFVTLKYPSDKDDGDNPVTQKYPSDGDDDLPSK
jgi:hypothetical protein